ncbi:MAG: hypothetical protein WCF84_11665 [Anaerolineae bacterium]
MNRRIWAVIILVAATAVCICSGVGLVYFGLVYNQGPFSSESRASIAIRFQGGTRILLQADVSSEIPITDEMMPTEAAILRKRLNALGISSRVSIQDDRHLLVELPGKNLQEQTIRAAIAPGLLEFVDLGDQPLDEGTVIQTTGLTSDNSCFRQSAGGSGNPPSPVPTSPASGKAIVYRTVMTGDCLSAANVAFDQQNQPEIQFSLNSEGTQILAEHTSTHVGKYLAIVLDKKVITSPRISSPITGGNGVIVGAFTRQEATDLVVQLQYGALPFPLKISNVTPFGP